MNFKGSYFFTINKLIDNSKKEDFQLIFKSECKETSTSGNVCWNKVILDIDAIENKKIHKGIMIQVFEHNPNKDSHKRLTTFEGMSFCDIQHDEDP